jgi:hypothetical protein
MLTPDILGLSEAELGRVRIVSGVAPGEVHPDLSPFLMPYDERLEDPGSQWRGTRSDFAARATRHFAEQIVPSLAAGDAQAHRAAVEASLAAWTRPAAPKRERRSDEEILALLRTHWEATGGRSGRLLRVMRDDLGIACEQGRMAGLVNRVRLERTAT